MAMLLFEPPNGKGHHAILKILIKFDHAHGTLTSMSCFITLLQDKLEMMFGLLKCVESKERTMASLDETSNSPAAFDLLLLF